MTVRNKVCSTSSLISMGVALRPNTSNAASTLVSTIRCGIGAAVCVMAVVVSAPHWRTALLCEHMSCENKGGLEVQHHSQVAYAGVSRWPGAGACCTSMARRSLTRSTGCGNSGWDTSMQT